MKSMPDQQAVDMARSINHVEMKNAMSLCFV
jgi:hypothetical protein